MEGFFWFWLAILYFVAMFALCRALWRWLQRKPNRPLPTRRVAGGVPPRPRFRDFRNTGATYHESQNNYGRALREWQRQYGMSTGDNFVSEMLSDWADGVLQLQYGMSTGDNDDSGNDDSGNDGSGNDD